MKDVVVSRILPATPDVAFAACTDLARAPQRIRGITKLEVLGDGRVGLGTRFRETRVMFGRESTEAMEITEWSPPQSFVVEADSHGTQYRTRFSFEPAGSEATRVTLRFGATPRSFVGKVMGFLFSGMRKSVEKCLVDDLDDIAAWLETPGTKTSRGAAQGG